MPAPRCTGQNLFSTINFIIGRVVTLALESRSIRSPLGSMAPMCMAGIINTTARMPINFWIYSDDDEGRKLRLLKGGRLRVTRVQVSFLSSLNRSQIFFIGQGSSPFEPLRMQRWWSTQARGDKVKHRWATTWNLVEEEWNLPMTGTVSLLETWGAMSSWSWQCCTR